MVEASVIMATYNEKSIWIKEAIESILKQSYKNFEFIIVIDNPENVELKTLLQEYREKDNRVKLIFNRENLGLVRSLNLAIEQSNGEYIVRMDADDISKKNRIEKQIKFMKKRDIDILGTNIDCIDENGTVVGEKILNKYNEKILLLKNILVHPTLIYKRSLINEMGGYKEALYAEDYEFLIRAICFNKKIDMLDEVLLEYRVRSNSITREKTIEQMETVKYIQKVYKNYRKNKEYIFNEKEIKTELENMQKTKKSLKIIIDERNKVRRVIKKIKFIMRNPKYKDILLLNGIKVKGLEIQNRVFEVRK